MLRRRIEKLELLAPRSPRDLIRDLERQAVASLSPEDRMFFTSIRNPGRRDRFAKGVDVANQHYQENLANLVNGVSDLGLDQMLASFGVPTQVGQ